MVVAVVLGMLILAALALSCGEFPDTNTKRLCTIANRLKLIVSR